MIYDGGRKDYQSVYVQNSFRNNGDIRINTTKRILDKYQFIEELQLYQLGKEFFSSISDSSYWPKSYRLLELHNWDEFGDNIRVISNDIPSTAVLVCVDKWAQDIQTKFDEYMELLENPLGNPYNQKASLREIMRALSPYCLNLSTNELSMLYEISKQKQELAMKTPLQMITDQYDNRLGLTIFNKSHAML